MLLLNLIITLVCLWVILRVNSLFIQPARWNKYRFRLFELRDNLALLSMKGQISENSDEYSTLMTLINTSIKETNKFQVVNFLRSLRRIQKNKEFQDRIDGIMQKLNSDNKEYQMILHNYFETIHEMLKEQTRFFQWVADPLIVFLSCCMVLTTIVSSLKRKLEVLNSLELDIQEKREKTLCHAHIYVRQ